MCGVIYDTPNKEVDRVEWSKTLRRLNAHESKRCRAARRGADGKPLPAKPGADGSVMGPPSAAAAAAAPSLAYVQHDPAAVRPQLPRRAAHRPMEKSQAEADWAVLESGGRRKIGERLCLGRHRSQWSRVKRKKIGPSQLNETRNLIRVGSWGDLPDGGVDSQARRRRLSRHQSADSLGKRSRRHLSKHQSADSIMVGSQGAPGARSSLSRNSSGGSLRGAGGHISPGGTRSLSSADSWGRMVGWQQAHHQLDGVGEDSSDSGSSIAYPVDTSKPSMQMDFLIAQVQQLHEEQERIEQHQQHQLQQRLHMQMYLQRESSGGVASAAEAEAAEAAWHQARAQAQVQAQAQAAQARQYQAQSHNYRGGLGGMDFGSSASIGGGGGGFGFGSAGSFGSERASPPSSQGEAQGMQVQASQHATRTRRASLANIASEAERFRRLEVDSHSEHVARRERRHSRQHAVDAAEAERLRRLRSVRAADFEAEEERWRRGAFASFAVENERLRRMQEIQAHQSAAAEQRRWAQREAYQSAEIERARRIRNERTREGGEERARTHKRARLLQKALSSDRLVFAGEVGLLPTLVDEQFASAASASAAGAGAGAGAPAAAAAAAARPESDGMEMEMDDGHMFDI